MSERFEYFKNAVRKDIDSKKKLSVDSINEKKRLAVRKLDDELQKSIKKYYGEKLEKMETDSRKKISAAETENKKKLILLRNSYKDEVYEEAYKRLKSMKGTDEYYSALEKKLSEALSMILEPENSVIHISPEDAKHIDLNSIKVEKAEYALGGFEIDADNGKGYIDCRFETALKDEIGNFINKLGVVI